MFRDARIDDIDAVLELYAHLHPADEPASPAQLRATFEWILATDGLSLFVLERDGAVVATTYLNVIPNLTRGASPYAVIENVVVDKAFRGMGLGKEIMAGTLAAAWEAGCYKVMLLTGSRRESTHAFYRSCGFDADAKSAFLARPPS